MKTFTWGPIIAMQFDRSRPLYGGIGHAFTRRGLLENPIKYLDYTLKYSKLCVLDDNETLVIPKILFVGLDYSCDKNGLWEAEFKFQEPNEWVLRLENQEYQMYEAMP